MLNPVAGPSSASQSLPEILFGSSGMVEPKVPGAVKQGGRIKGTSEESDFSTEMQAMASALALQSSFEKSSNLPAESFQLSLLESVSELPKKGEKASGATLEGRLSGERSGGVGLGEVSIEANKLTEFNEQAGQLRLSRENPQGLTDPGALIQSRNPEITLERAGVQAGQILSQPSPWNARWVLGRAGVFSDPSNGGTPVTPLFGEDSLINGSNTKFGAATGALGAGSAGSPQSLGVGSANEADIAALLRAVEPISVEDVQLARQVGEQKMLPTQLSGSEFLSLRDPQAKLEPTSSMTLGGSLEKAGLATPNSLDEQEVSQDELSNLRLTQGRSLKSVKGSPSEKIQGIPLLSERSKRDRGDRSTSEEGNNFGSSIPSLSTQWPGGTLDGGARVGAQESKFFGAHEVTASVVPGSRAKERLSTDSLTGIAGNIRSFATQGGATGGVGEMRIRLRPEALGELTLKVRTQGQEVGLEFHASSDQARKVIEESMQHLRDKLGSHHLNLSSVEVSVGQWASTGGSFDGSSGSQQQNSQQSSFQNGNSFQTTGNSSAFGQSLSDSSGGRSGAREDRAGDAPGLSPVRAGSSGLLGAQAMQTYRGNLGGRGRIDVKV